MMIVDPGKVKLSALLDTIVTSWPEHRPYIEKSFAERSGSALDVSEDLADAVTKIAADVPGGIATLCADYRFLCEEIVLPEELHFRRNSAYRLSSFEDANRECYANADFMNRYMNGLLVSDIVWDNHARAIASYVTDYLPSLADGSDHLEIGPGHGIFLYFATQARTVGSVSGWDVSPTSIANTRHALDVLGVTRPVSLTLQNLYDASGSSEGGDFDSIVMSEILEHLEDPVEAMRAAAKWLRPGGKMWINVPANSPAPDHIFLLNGLDHLSDLVREAGLEIVDTAEFAMSGTTLEKARKRKLAISCIVTARRPAH